MSKLLEQINTAKKTNLERVCHYVTDKIDVSELSLDDYISTENMIPARGGVMQASKLPVSGKVTKFKINDTLTSNIRPYFKKIWQATISGGCSNDVLVIRPNNKNEFNGDFLYYILSEDTFFAYSMMSSHGTKMPRGDKEAIMKYEVPFPDLPTQKRIAEILGAYDAKIENNNKIIKNLEATAQTIFNEWFVNFRFPGYEKVKMVESEMGEIPEGWEVKPLDEIAEFLNGVASQKYPPEDVNNSLPVIKIREMNSGIDKNSDRATKNIDSKYIIKNGDILFAWSGSLSLMVWVCGEGLLNQHIFKVTSENYPKWFIYYYTNKHLQNFKTIAEGKATTMGHIQRHHLTESKVIVPDKSILKNANTTIEPVFEQQILLQEENIVLKQSRDQLLAKLI